eukprot:TRINITY_DN24881_c0_g1_i1.p1 TRINITY_DN24881_c0_g1~~TRINITY_DN24881_c0_g1_i1.p1  ORF type:complete len:127 (+),score=28.89 TRINITY_DN24881_c0_g1_i1:105-485(+)
MCIRDRLSSMSIGADDEYYDELERRNRRATHVVDGGDKFDEDLAPRSEGDLNGYDSFDYDCYESQQWLQYQLSIDRDKDDQISILRWIMLGPVSYTHLRAHETVLDLVCRLLLEKKKKNTLTLNIR